MLTLSASVAVGLFTRTVTPGALLPPSSATPLAEGKIYLMLVDFIGYSLLIVGVCLVLYLLGLVALCAGDRSSVPVVDRHFRRRGRRSKAGFDDRGDTRRVNRSESSADGRRLPMLPGQ